MPASVSPPRPNVTRTESSQLLSGAPHPCFVTLLRSVAKRITTTHGGGPHVRSRHRPTRRRPCPRRPARAGNPFRNYFARNPDDEVCAATTSPSCSPPSATSCSASSTCTATTRRRTPRSCPILGNKGAGKTHLLHSIKHGADGAWQLLVTPGVYQKDTDFLEYLLFQIIDTLLGGGKQKGVRPLEYVGEQLVPPAARRRACAS